MVNIDYKWELSKVLNLEGIEPKEREKIMGLLNDLRKYHEPTWEHSIRVGLKARQIAAFSYYDPRAGLYAVLHDIGKLDVPKEILDKTTNFTEKDMAIVKVHVLAGSRILSSTGHLFSSRIALTHHRFQANFYPSDEELAGYRFPIKDAHPETRLLADGLARLVSIADAYDATRTRANSRFGGRIPSAQEVRETLLRDNPGRKGLIEALYEDKIL